MTIDFNEVTDVRFLEMEESNSVELFMGSFWNSYPMSRFCIMICNEVELT